MNLVFRLSPRPDLKEAQRLSEALDRQRGVISALVDPQLAQVYVTYEPEMLGDMALQSVVEAMGFQVIQEAEPMDFSTESPGYVREIQNEEAQLARADGLLMDAEFSLPEREEYRP